MLKLMGKKKNQNFKLKNYVSFMKEQLEHFNGASFRSTNSSSIRFDTQHEYTARDTEIMRRPT